MTEGMGEALPSYLVEGALNYLSDMTGFSELHADMIERGHVRNTMVVPAGATNIHGNAHGGFILGLLDSTCG
ncbi:MAG: PaaI family thioesterase, partial [Slackia sp.]|nr:PaaI family thioesterase [Slackia sp.]